MSDTQKHTKPNVPNLRFPGFEGEWESRRIGEDCAVNMCKRIFANQTSEQGDVPFFKIGTIGGTPDAYISRDLFEEYKAKYNYPRKGEVMITCAGTVGKTIVFDGEDAYFQDSNIVWLSNQKQLYINPFLNYVLSRVNWNKLNSTTITRIYNDNLRELVINYPSIKEQEKIVALLSLLDQRILTQNKVIEKYESLIKALAHEIIGKHAPNIMLSECVHCASSTLKESDLAEAGAVPAYGAAGISGFTDSALSDGDSILITKDGSGVGSLRYVSGLHSFVGTLNSMTPKDGIYLPYIYYALQNVCFETYRTGQAIPHIYFRDYGKEAIYCPAYDDQKRLAKRLELLDAKIGIERAVLRNLQSAKAFLLSGMFI